VDATHWTDLLDVLERCAGGVPLYESVVLPEREPVTPAEHGRRALASFPVLTRDRVRAAFPHGLVPKGESLKDALKRGEVALVGTTGTSGDRVQVLWHQPWWDAQDRDGFGPHPIAREVSAQASYREAVLTTPICSGTTCHASRLSMEERIEDDRLLFLNQTADPALWTDADVARMADELETFAPAAIEGDPAYLAFFVTRLARLGRKPYRPRFVYVSYELPSILHVRAIAAAFGVPVLDAYGSTECGCVFLECERGRLHQNARWTHAEVLPVARVDGAGFLVLTPLRNRWLNLVRYDTGDLVRLARDPCACGNTDGLALESVEGRARDSVFAADGRALPPRTVDRAMATVDGLLHFRLLQTSALEAELDLVPNERAELDLRRATEAAASVLGFEPRARVATSIPVEASGKFRLCKAAHVDAEKVLRGGT
jgi:phenylacetate-CoA ligase